MSQGQKHLAAIKLDDVQYDGAIYPRQKPSSHLIAEYADALAGGAQFPPIILEEGTNRLLDGYHRWKAYLKYREGYVTREDDQGDTALPVPSDTIPCDYRMVPEGITAKLYALSLSTTHGLRPTNAEKEGIVREEYTANQGIALTILSKYTSASIPTIRKYLKDLIAKFEETKQHTMTRLDRLGWTQEEIAEHLQKLFPAAKGTAQKTVSNFLVETENFPFLLKSDFAKGHVPATVAQRYDIPLILAWAAKLEDLDDAEKMAELGITLQPYDVWNFARCDDLYGNDWPGRIPGQLIAHVLYFFTNPEELVLDPMSGSGTTQDVCLAMNRKNYGYDMNLEHGRPDVLQHDLQAGWPKRVKKADLIFWDPPYFDKKDDLYVDGSVSGLERTAYLAFFQERFREAYTQVEKGTRLAFLMSDWDDEKGNVPMIGRWHYAHLMEQAGWTITRVIDCPLSTQLVHPDIVEKFRKSRRLARLNRSLLIGERR